MRAFYLDENVGPISNIRTVVHLSPKGPFVLLDSVIAFLHEFFRQCASLSKVKRQIKDVSIIDLEFDMPRGWKKLKEEALFYFKKLRINSATFEEPWRLDR